MTNRIFLQLILAFAMSACTFEVVPASEVAGRSGGQGAGPGDGAGGGAGGGGGGEAGRSGCVHPCDCPQGEGCVDGKCEAGETPEHCCNVDGCSAGEPCTNDTGEPSVCEEVEECVPGGTVSCEEEAPLCDRDGACVAELNRCTCEWRCHHEDAPLDNCGRECKEATKRPPVCDCSEGACAPAHCARDGDCGQGGACLESMCLGPEPPSGEGEGEGEEER